MRDQENKWKKRAVCPVHGPVAAKICNHGLNSNETFRAHAGAMLTAENGSRSSQSHYSHITNTGQSLQSNSSLDPFASETRPRHTIESCAQDAHPIVRDEDALADVDVVNRA